jgi:hypothetical protein
VRGYSLEAGLVVEVELLVLSLLPDVEEDDELSELEVDEEGSDDELDESEDSDDEPEFDEPVEVFAVPLSLRA